MVKRFDALLARRPAHRGSVTGSRGLRSVLRHDGSVTSEERPGPNGAPGTTVEVIFGDMLTGARDRTTFVVPEHGMPERLDHAGTKFIKRLTGGQGRPYWYIHAHGREGQLRSYSYLLGDPQST